LDDRTFSTEKNLREMIGKMYPDIKMDPVIEILKPILGQPFADVEPKFAAELIDKAAKTKGVLENEYLDFFLTLAIFNAEIKFCEGLAKT